MAMFQHTKENKPSFLVPLDGSHLAESVLPTVEHLASRFRAKVILLHVMEQHAPVTIHGERHLTGVAEAQTYLEEIATRLRFSAISVKTHVREDREDNVARSIVEHAQKSKTDLVIMCSHGRGGLRDFLFGSIAQQALRRGTQSVLLVLPRDDCSAPTFDLRRILVPLDGAVAHEPALPVAKTLAHAFSAEVQLVVIIPTLATLSGSQAVSGLLLPTTMKAVLDLAEQGASDYLEQAVVQCRAQGIPAQAKVLRGDAVAEVLHLAERLNVDLIVMASHGRVGLDAMLTGSVAPRITGRISRPLWLVRAGESTGENNDERN